MTIKLSLLLSMLFLFSITSLYAEGPLNIKVPENAKLEYKAQQGMQFYSISWDGSAVWMLSKWPVPGTPDQIPTFLQMMKDKFVETAKTTKAFDLTEETVELQDIQGKVFSGKIAVFELKTQGIMEPAVQTMYMVSDGKTIWNGQFTGPKKMLESSIDLIKSIQLKEGE